MAGEQTFKNSKLIGLVTMHVIFLSRSSKSLSEPSTTALLSRRLQQMGAGSPKAREFHLISLVGLDPDPTSLGS
jgi:hypothetical protein